MSCAVRRCTWGEIAILCGEHFIITVRHGHASPLEGVRAELDGDPERLAGGTGVLLHAIVDRVVDDYQHMPELRSLWGYPFALGLMAVVCGLLYRSFRNSDWL